MVGVDVVCGGGRGLKNGLWEAGGKVEGEGVVVMIQVGDVTFGSFNTAISNNKSGNWLFPLAQ